MQASRLCLELSWQAAQQPALRSTGSVGCSCTRSVVSSTGLVVLQTVAGAQHGLVWGSGAGLVLDPFVALALISSTSAFWHAEVLLVSSWAWQLLVEA